MARIPDIGSTNMSPMQRATFDQIASSPRGTVEGPLRIWLHSAELADKSQALGAYCRYRTFLPPRLSELAIITIGAFWRAGFEWHIHAPIAAAGGVEPAAIEAIRTGKRPSLRLSDEVAVYEYTRSLIADRTVSAALFDQAQSLLGIRGMVDLTGVIGYYSYVAMTITAFEVATPGGDPFEEPSTGATPPSFGL